LAFEFFIDHRSSGKDPAASGDGSGEEAELRDFAAPRFLVAALAAGSVPLFVLGGGVGPATGAALFMLILQAVPASLALSRGERGTLREVSAGLFPLVCLAAAVLGPVPAAVALLAAALLPFEAAAAGTSPSRALLFASGAGAAAAAAGVFGLGAGWPAAVAAGIAVPLLSGRSAARLAATLAAARGNAAAARDAAELQMRLATEPMLRLAADGSLLAANGAALAILPEEGSGWDWRAAIHPFDRAALDAAAAMVRAEGGTVRLPLRLVDADRGGAPRAFEARLAGLPGGRAGVGTDICLIFARIEPVPSTTEAAVVAVSAYDRGGSSGGDSAVVRLRPEARARDSGLRPFEEVSRRA